MAEHRRLPHHVLITAGTAGDLYPFMSLAKGLQALGREVTLIVPAFHFDMVRAAGLPCLAVGVPEDHLKVIGNPDLWDPYKGFAMLMANYRNLTDSVCDALQSVVAGRYGVVIAHLFALPAVAMARELGADVSIVGAQLAPSNMRSCLDPLFIGHLPVPRWVPLAWRRALWRFVDRRFIDPFALPPVNAARTTRGLKPIDGSFLPNLGGLADLSLTLFPAWFAAPLTDWPQPLLMGDFQLFDPGANEPLPPALTAFLAAGEAPIVFTPGTGHQHAAAYFSAATAVVQRLGRRAIFLTRHHAQVPPDLPASVLWLAYVPMRDLLPHASVLVHHGGIGTTAEALRAGVPQLVVPFAWDQFANGAQVVALGAGASLSASRLTEPRLRRRLQCVLSSNTVRARCRKLARGRHASPLPSHRPRTRGGSGARSFCGTREIIRATVHRLHGRQQDLPGRASASILRRPRFATAIGPPRRRPTH